MSAGTRRRKSSDSHETGSDSFGIVYVNELARHALLYEGQPQFPVGSIIVREKLARADDATPQILVALVKRERGFNPKANDWEFLVLDGSSTRIQRREKTGSCRDCHAQQKESDFVFRSYLPEAVRSPQQ
ncbi:MAG TPA: cytochrome P460 family protein [Pyrinomonadaceae bacterium]|nr:cytochrome P460 family protein [Pyrinomonadaceae bacterium]